MYECMALYEPHRFVKIDLDSNYIQLKNLYIYSNNYRTLTAPRFSRAGERRIDQKIEKLECQMPKNSP